MGCFCSKQKNIEGEAASPPVRVTPLPTPQASIRSSVQPSVRSGAAAGNRTQAASTEGSEHPRVAAAGSGHTLAGSGSRCMSKASPTAAPSESPAVVVRGITRLAKARYVWQDSDESGSGEYVGGALPVDAFGPSPRYVFESRR
ncbi:hypothetical protein CLCR_03173 [Cladophialophora carrionii]|uniref:Uncharacterized protein n=1 Tax=Cladophialophora carrionii TaxID=86049 RepID=A0A1C1D1T5_9EURO|nr:hypothetical protein CLCR_03173 [Cladophialophora carrionii]